MEKNALSPSRCYAGNETSDIANGSSRNRQYVHEKTDGKVGYVHIPDMMGRVGMQSFIAASSLKVSYPGLLIDVRYNSGGHVSQLILEKLSRRRASDMMFRAGEKTPHPYPDASVLGPHGRRHKRECWLRWRHFLALLQANETR